MRLKADMDKLRRIFINEGSQSWGELREKTGWSLSVIKDRIDLMIKRGEISTKVGVRNNRRKTLYCLSNEEKSKAESAKYEAIQFIEKISTPVYGYHKKRRVSVSAFLGPVANGKREEAHKIVQGYADKMSGFLRFLPKSLPNRKLAIILTVED